MKKKDNRFVVISEEGSSMNTSGKKIILVDKETGVTYLIVHSGYGHGITPLLDASGKPIITSIVEEC